MAKDQTKKPRMKREATLAESIILVLLLFATFGAGAVFGLNYVPLMVFVCAFAAFVGWRCGYTWKEMEEAVARRVQNSFSVIVMLLGIGFMLAGLMFSGVLPMIIYYGLQIVEPRWIALCGFLLCAIFSTATGTSNGSASTAGMAIMIMAMAMDNVNVGLVAGAVYAGSMFGDKLSPLSDTTVLAPMTANVDLFDHIATQARVTVPAAIVSIIIYVIVGLTSHTTGAATSAESVALLTDIAGLFKFNVVLLLPIVFIVWGSITGKPATLVMFGAGIIGIILGVVVQGFSIPDGINALYGGFKSSYCLAVHPEVAADSLSASTLTLLERGGISDMNKTFVATIFCFYFAGIAELIGVLRALLDTAGKFIKGTGSLILTTGIMTVILIMVGGSSTVALLLSGSMFKEKYDEMGVNRVNLSATLEHFGTGCSGFFPWTSSGILYMAVLFQDSTFTFLKYSFFSWMVWIFALICAFTGFNFQKGPTKRQLAAMEAEKAEQAEAAAAKAY